MTASPDQPGNTDDAQQAHAEEFDERDAIVPRNEPALGIEVDLVGEGEDRQDGADASARRTHVDHIGRVE